MLSRGGYLLYGTSDCFWQELAHFGEFSGKSNFGQRAIALLKINLGKGSIIHKVANSNIVHPINIILKKTDLIPYIYFVIPPLSKLIVLFPNCLTLIISVFRYSKIISLAVPFQSHQFLPLKLSGKTG